MDENAEKVGLDFHQHHLCERYEENAGSTLRFAAMDNKHGILEKERRKREHVLLYIHQMDVRIHVNNTHSTKTTQHVILHQWSTYCTYTI